ncbi:MAG: anti-sigma factor family protein [Chloroflexota bacterium]
MEHVSELLSPYADGQVSAGQLQLVESHLAGCADCRRELAELRATSELLRRLPPYEPPGPFALGPRTAAPANRAVHMAARFRPLSSVAAVLVVAAVGFSWGLGGLPRNPAAPAVPTGQAQSRAMAARPPAAAAPVAAVTAPSRAAAPAAANLAAPTARGAATAPRPASAAYAPGPPAKATGSGARPAAQQASLNLSLFLGDLVILLLAAAGGAISTARWLAQRRE